MGEIEDARKSGVSWINDLRCR